MDEIIYILFDSNRQVLNVLTSYMAVKKFVGNQLKVPHVITKDTPGVWKILLQQGEQFVTNGWTIEEHDVF